MATLFQHAEGGDEMTLFKGTVSIISSDPQAKMAMPDSQRSPLNPIILSIMWKILSFVYVSEVLDSKNYYFLPAGEIRLDQTKL